jgi:hypothetical protein
MSDALKTPLSRTLSEFTVKKVLDEIRKRGTPLPGHVVSVSGSIVTVNFDVQGVTLPNITMPVIGAEYVRLPIQEGDLGAAWPSSIYLGGVSGLGGGVADLTLRGNLSALVWIPIGNKNWAPPTDPNSLELYGPDGVILKDEGGNVVATLNTTNGFKVTFGGHTFEITSGGIFLDGTLWTTHDHGPGAYVAGETPVTGTSGGVVG